MSRPKVFISSTVFDFRDLRSAVKFWLEEHGYDVQLSEYNDFRKNLDKNSFDACLEAIDSSDFFLLLIGARVGGLYDRDKRESITRMEYRRAYEALRERRLKMIVLVRREVWDLREDRKGLKEYLLQTVKESKELNDEELSAIVNHPSTLVNDAKSIFDFLGEVARVEEMRAAQEKGEDFPPGNWISPFHDFRDVIDLLRANLIATRPLRRATVEANVRHELLTIGASLSGMIDEGLFFDYWWSSSSREHLGSEGSEYVRLPAKAAGDLGLWIVFCRRGHQLRDTSTIDSAIDSGVFLEYDRETDSYNASSIQKRLLQLRNQIRRLKHLEDFPKGMMETAGDLSGARRGDKPVSVSRFILLTALALADCHINIVNLCRAIYLALDGQTEHLDRLEIRPTTPDPEMANRIEKERPTLDDVREFFITGDVKRKKESADEGGASA